MTALEQLGSCPRCGHSHRWHVMCNQWMPLAIDAPILRDHAEWVGVMGTGCTCGTGVRSPDPTVRPAISSAVRREVIERDGRICVFCGRRLPIRTKDPSRRLTLDHIVPFSLGGDDSAINLRVACQGCNSRRGNRTDIEPGAWIR